MNLYIQLDSNGNPINHPIIESNLLDAYPGIDVNNLPQNFARFIRVQQPEGIGVYEKTTVEYQVINGVVQDVWSVLPMTSEEIAAKQNKIKQDWQQYGGYASWVFDETICNFVPPIPYPNDELKYQWDENQINWILVTSEE